MKVYVYQDCFRIYLMVKEDQHVREYNINYLGELNLDIKPEKKLVTRETPARFGEVVSVDTYKAYGHLPLIARNVRLVYEIEE